MLERTIKPLQIQGAKKNLLVALDVPTDLPERICADTIRLQQVLINLMGNAIKFTERGMVTLRVTASAGSNHGVPLLFVVQDTGIGVPPEKQKLIFEAFSQADGSTSRRFGGTGLGLSICSRLVGQMGGQIQLSSVPGEGSCFQFQITVPVAELLTEEKIGVEHTEVTPTVARRLYILLAEDNPINQKLAVRLLEKQGHRVFAVKNGREAIEQVGAQEFDLVLMDISMPEMDGLEATAVLRTKTSGKRRIPIIAMTAHALSGDRETCLRAGMDGYVSKPIKASDLFKAMDEVLAVADLPVAASESRG